MYVSHNRVQFGYTDKVVLRSRNDHLSVDHVFSISMSG